MLPRFIVLRNITRKAEAKQYLTAHLLFCGQIFWQQLRGGKGFKLKEGQFRLNIRKKFLPLRLMSDWLPREAVDIPDLKAGYNRLDVILRNLI